MVFLISFFALGEGEQSFFIKESFVHLYDFKSLDSSYKKTFICGTPVKVLEKKGGWAKVRFRNSEGFVKSLALSSLAPQCFHEKYPVFYEALDIDNADLYYWGKLSRQ